MSSRSNSAHRSNRNNNNNNNNNNINNSSTASAAAAGGGGGVMTKESRKAALEKVEAQTLFARNKLQKALESVQNEHQEFRYALYSQRIQMLAKAETLFKNGLDIIDFQERERARRDRMMNECRRGRRAMGTLFNQEFELVEIQEMQRESRGQIVKYQIRNFSRVAFAAGLEHDVVKLVEKETYYRQQVLNEEFERSNRLFDLSRWLQQQVETFIWNCIELERVYKAIREEIIYECSTSYRQLMQAHSTRSTHVMEQLQQRSHFLEEYHSSLRQLEIQENGERTEIKRIFIRQRDELEAFLVVQAEERQQFLNTETHHRSQLRSEETARFHALIDYEAQCRDEVVELTNALEMDRVSCLEDALSDLRSVMQREDAAREKLAQDEEHHRELRRQLIAENALARERLLNDAYRALTTIEVEEESERGFISQRSVDNELLVRIRIENHEADRRSFEASEDEARFILDNQREASLYNLSLLMREAESEVQRTVASHAARRQNVEQLEAKLRSDLERHESDSRDFIADELFRLLEEHNAFEQQQHNEREALEREAIFAIRTNVLDLYDAQFEEIFETTFSLELENAFLAQCDREHNELFDAERRFRNKGTVIEFEERSRLHSFYCSELRELARIDRDRAEHELALLCSEETFARDEIRRDSEEEQEALSQWAYRDERHARHMTEARLETEKLEHQRALCGEEKCNEEMFLEPLRMSRSYPLQNNNHVNSSSHHHHHQQNNNYSNFSTKQQQQQQQQVRQQEEGGEGEEQRQLIMNTEEEGEEPAVGVFSHGIASVGRMSMADVRRSVSVAQCGDGDRDLKLNYLSSLLKKDREHLEKSLSDEQIDFLTALLEKSSQWRAEKEQAAAVAEEKMRKKEKELLRAETLERSKKDAVEYYQTKIEEEKARFHQTLRNEKTLVQKAKKQSKIEEMRAVEMESRLKKQTEANAQLRDELHRKMSSRH